MTIGVLLGLMEGPTLQAPLRPLELPVLFRRMQRPLCLLESLCLSPVLRIWALLRLSTLRVTVGRWDQLSGSAEEFLVQTRHPCHRPCAEHNNHT